MRHLLLAALLCSSAAPSSARKQKKPAPAPAESKLTTGGGETKSKTYTFTGLDIDGKLKTPQLLYFLNRMKSEFDTTAPDKKSFLPELRCSVDEM
jgi:hypothetical protein